ncbi:MAG: alpha/beta fold hydrolase [Phycisphaeraceae bacterium]|nr:alpha/beta fold hydrolase [Phycisphaeraceae bacterium]
MNPSPSTAASSSAPLWTIDAWPDLDLEIKPWAQPYAGTPEGAKALELRFNSVIYHDQPTRIFGVAVLQPQPRDCPTVVLVHGGGGVHRSFDGWRSRSYLQSGYNVLSLDLPGKGESRDASRSTGPDMNEANLFSPTPPRAGWLWHAVAAVRRMLDVTQALACGRPLVLEGWSWGGVTSLLTAGADARLTAVIAVYGSGTLRRGNLARSLLKLEAPVQEQWRTAFDPARQTYRRDLAIYLPTAANDEFFTLADNVRTWRAIGLDHAHFLACPNQNHNLDADGMRSISALAQGLRQNAPLNFAKVQTLDHSPRLVTAHCTGPARQVIWNISSQPVEDPPTLDWTKIKWDIRPAAVAQNRATIDAQELDGRVWFATAAAESGLLSSTPLYLAQHPLDV